MRTFTILAAIGILAVTASGGEFAAAHRGKVDSTAMNFEATHLSMQQCNDMNYVVGRSMSWNIGRESFFDTTAAVETMGTTSGASELQPAEKTPAWISDLQDKAKAYQTERKDKAKRNDERLSGYSPTELAIARNMGLFPWDIDRKQLKKWAQEVESIAPTL